MSRIPDEIIEHAQHLLDEGHSDMAVARMVGIGYSTVARIRAGERGVYGRALRVNVPRFAQVAALRNAERCPECGRMVTLPCRACAVEQQIETGRLPEAPEVDGAGEPYELPDRADVPTDSAERPVFTPRRLAAIQRRLSRSFVAGINVRKSRSVAVCW